MPDEVTEPAHLIRMTTRVRVTRTDDNREILKVTKPWPLVVVVRMVQRSLEPHGLPPDGVAAVLLQPATVLEEERGTTVVLSSQSHPDHRFRVVLGVEQPRFLGMVPVGIQWWVYAAQWFVARPVRRGVVVGPIRRPGDDERSVDPGKWPEARDGAVSAIRRKVLDPGSSTEVPNEIIRLAGLA